MIKRIYIILISVIMLLSCDGSLSKEPLDVIKDKPELWSIESVVRNAVQKYYVHYFPGYCSGWTRSDWFSQTNIADWTDDNAQEKATFFIKNIPTTAKNTEWNFEDVRNLNLLLKQVSSSSLQEKVKKHWIGVIRFLRAMKYARLVSYYGDVPWFDEPLESSNHKDLYRPRDARTVVMDRVLQDLLYASENTLESDIYKKLSVNKDVVNAFASRIMLFEGTWQKYRVHNEDYAKKYLKVAKDMAEKVISSGRYSICPDFKSLTTSEDLSRNPEIILYRNYQEGIVTHSLMSFQNTQSEVDSPSKSLIDAYLTRNGLPIAQKGNKESLGDKSLKDEMMNRDPRLSAIIYTNKLYLNGIEAIYAVSGYFGNRFVNEELKSLNTGKSTNCITDAPVMKLNEVLMNYIEAAAELHELGAYELSQSDFDKTINVLRDRKSTHMPHLTLSGNDLMVSGIVINDPDRESDVPSIIWEIRRERRVELVYEGKRFHDLRRWNKLYYADMIRNPKINLGSWIDKEAFVKAYNEQIKKNGGKEISMRNLSKMTLDREGTKGYIKPIINEQLMRTVQERDYLYPIPLDQITLYEKYGVKLKNNLGW